jgi:hypothetical protein
MTNTRLVHNVPKERRLETHVMTTTFSSSSAPFRVEAKLEIPMFNGQTNVEALDGWLKQLEFYFGLYQIL